MKFKILHKVCINLPRSHERRLAVTTEFEKIGLFGYSLSGVSTNKFIQQKSVYFFPAIDKNDLTLPEISAKQSEGHALGVLACAKSHIEVIRFAKEQDWEAVCVFEDDVIFCDDFNDRINYIESLNLDFDIFCLGGHFSKQIQESEAFPAQHKNIFEVKKMGGTYGLIFTKKTYDFILRNWNYNYGADEFYSTFVYSRFKTYAFVPFLVGCADVKSDILDRKFFYENVSWHYQQESVFKPAPQKQIKTDKLDLSNCTFIIPVRIESFDREFNLLRVIDHLCKHLKTNIIIFESDSSSKASDLLTRVNQRECNIIYHHELTDNAIFHRTRLLNCMIKMVDTPITVNYDVDVLLKPETYVEAVNKILSGCDLVYPYGQNMAQVQIKYPNRRAYMGEDLFDKQYHSEWGSLCGHVQFFKTSVYREGFMENENFISYGAEDAERMKRFQKLGYRVEWMNGHMVYHIEHERGANSSPENPHFSTNEGLYYHLAELPKDQLIKYYQNQEYLKKYV